MNAAGDIVIPTSVLAHVRGMTRDAHLAIEGSLGLMDDALELDTYKNALVRLYGFWRSWEPQIASLISDEPFLAQRRRGHLLASDLAALGVSANALEALRPCPVTNVSTAMGALGSLYVMEGSSLGGRTILRNVDRHLGSAVHASRSYFVGYGGQTGPMWRSFLARLEDVPPSCKHEIGDGALATFQTLGAWLASPVDERLREVT